ncbi:hypothetical protein YYC_04784 [Plasmodium yoelii 17X]|uniref:YIR protein n=1 Tax=Plasmodium yoelii 17X TaxID=1323249 RepID=V7PF40_PLAYE|nr:hypothetical protein YYC_04784 [Plasmodium yoelii 17X]
MFLAVREWFPDELDSGNYKFIDDNKYRQHLTKETYTDIDKINGLCLLLFQAIFGNSYSYKNYANSNINVVAYILAWLSYKLNQKTENGITNLMDFYTDHMQNVKEYKESIKDVEEYKTYIDLINKNKDLLNIKFEYMSKFYDAFKLLCDMYNELDEVSPKCEKYLECDSEFLKKYEKLKKDSDINKDSSYSKIFSILSKDYDNLKNKCNKFPSLLTYSLISIAFIFVAIPIFLGISYKYSLFGFRKRFQKQKLREKIKNIKKKMCEKFQDVRNSLPDELDSSRNYQFKDDQFLNDYCNSNQCQSYFDRISAGCLYLLYQFYNDSGIFPSPKNSNPYIVDYILIWLSYMLNLGKSENKIIEDFYNPYINSCDQYKTHINELPGHDNYKDLIDERKDLLDMDIKIVSKFYEALKSLCKLYNELGNNKNCENYLKDNSEFFNIYEELKNDSDITGNKLYNQLLSTLSTDYGNFKKECNNILSPPPKETKENYGQTHLGIYGQDVDGLGQNVDSFVQNVDNSDVASSSSPIASKLIPVLLIFGAIPIFWGISYKYSLFGFRKRFQKQKLREKLKK